ncbi:MAG TPA: hypothetical protein ENK43_09455 [Planctomycetes bacterium]|nr:hypothetical protein [Planctomycetota bacterium]
MNEGKPMRWIVQALFAALLTSCAAPGGISENLNLSADTTPLVSTLKQAKEQTEANVNTAVTGMLDAALAVPAEILFFDFSNPNIHPTGLNQPILTPEERLAKRRHAMGLPDHAERRVAERRAARRRSMELGRNGGTPVSPPPPLPRIAPATSRRR